MSKDAEKEPEELAVESYMDRIKASEEGPSDGDRKEWYQLRYKFIKDQAKRLQLEREEIEATSSKKKDEMLANIRAAFTDNYKSRKAIVTELRKLGEKVDDQFIPLSAI
jgi:hypothetical protein